MRWWLLQGRLPEAFSWVQECGLSVTDPPSYLREYEHLTLAKVLIAQYQRDLTEEIIHQAIEFLTRLLSAAVAQERTGSIIKVLVVLALAHEAHGDLPAAISPLKRALTLAEPEGYVRNFAESGTPMAQLLQEAANRDITPDYTSKLLVALKTWGQFHNEAPTAAPQPLIEPLSQRELDVLRLLNTELSGPEIARELVVALSTVRTHTKRIYGKLNVTNRRAAVKRAAELELI